METPKLRISNLYYVADLGMKGLEGIPEFSNGFTQFVYEATPEVQAVIDSFNQPQEINLRDYVAHLRRIQDIIRNKKLEGGHNGNRSR